MPACMWTVYKLLKRTPQYTPTERHVWLIITAVDDCIGGIVCAVSDGFPGQIVMNAQTVRRGIDDSGTVAILN